MIEAFNLTKQFGDFTAVQDLNLSVSEGEVLALLGPNGAGKTTSVRMLGSILRPTSGYATVAGYNVSTQPRQVRQVIGLLTEFPGLYTRMQGIEYLNFFGELQGMPADVIRHRSEALLQRFELWEARSKRLGEYSKGMKQKLTLVRAMLHDPKVLFLDEPTSNMDPQSAKLVRDAILDLRGEKRTIVICTHNLNEAETLADRIAIINHGRIISAGPTQALKAKLLGDPLIQVNLARPLNGNRDLLADLPAVIEESGETWFRYRAADPVQVNPQVIRRLTEQDCPVVAVKEVSRSLEDVYLKIINQQQEVV